MDRMSSQPATIHLKDYQVPTHLIISTELWVEIFDDHTLVNACLTMARNPDSNHSGNSLRLDGIELEHKRLAVNGEELASGQFKIDSEGLTIHNVPEQFVLESTVVIHPENNSSLEGLYKSSIMYCTQCEAEGFRKITWYLDRPDVMSEFTTTIVADKSKYPVLLSNGNPTASADLADGRHSATWHDPFKKPSYLFALVAGDLECVNDSFTTMSGREVTIQLFVEAKDLDKCAYAIQSLKASMKWDEEVYGREYDLDIFMIVAVDDFNMGAMENKGLNIFNTSCVLAHPKTTTDFSFQRVEGVVAHEYFHNWSGNRVTCRDWFQLSLKEGFTVFRDAEFSSDMNSRTVKRIETVNYLRTFQFAEDAGPTAHPVQPDSFIDISNFYTLTIYEKGSEIVRMIYTLLGPEQFRKGSDLYFERHDGQAVTIEDFVAAMADASGRDFSQFMRWYKQAGTPVLDVAFDYNSNAQTLTLNFKQHTPQTPDKREKLPVVIPVKMGLVAPSGDIEMVVGGKSLGTDSVIEITESEQSITFDGVPADAVPSLLRGFSAPVRLNVEYTPQQLAQLMAADSDGYNRWAASQQLVLAVLKRNIATIQNGDTPEKPELWLDTCRTLLRDDSLDPAMVAQMLTIPSETLLHGESEKIDVDAIHRARNALRGAMGMALFSDWMAVYERCHHVGDYEPSAEQIARRSLKNIALTFALVADEATALELAEQQYHNADNMTDQMAALSALVYQRPKEGLTMRVLGDFYEQWQHEALVVNSWFSVQAAAFSSDANVLRGLLAHPAYDGRNPNKIRSVLGAFAMNNLINFHAADGSGYQLLTEQLLGLNKTNPQIASRMVIPLTRWHKFDAERQQQMKACLQQLLDTGELAKDVYEIVSKGLAE